jgi:hypothetical protein
MEEASERFERACAARGSGNEERTGSSSSFAILEVGVDLEAEALKAEDESVTRVLRALDLARTSRTACPSRLGLDPHALLL